MTEEHFLVTGAMGCIGAWTVANLVRDGAAVTAYDLGTDPYRLGYLLDEAELGKINFVQGDIADLEALERVVVDGRVSHIIHLAALQVPFCRADPMLGARVNVSGTVNVFEVARRHQEQVQRLVYASSAAVYGPNTAYDVSPAPVDAEMLPGTIYGVYKLANEGTARIYWQDDGVSSIGLRPYIVYGVGRDQGMTSGPSNAMIPVKGRSSAGDASWRIQGSASTGRSSSGIVSGAWDWASTSASACFSSHRTWARRRAASTRPSSRSRSTPPSWTPEARQKSSSTSGSFCTSTRRAVTWKSAVRPARCSAP